MRHLMIAGLGLLLATQAFAQGSTAAKSHAARNANTEAAAAYDVDRAATAPDFNAPGNGWGKKEVPESKPKSCSYDGAMSDEDIERCRR